MERNFRRRKLDISIDIRAEGSKEELDKLHELLNKHYDFVLETGFKKDWKSAHKTMYRLYLTIAKEKERGR